MVKTYFISRAVNYFIDRNNPAIIFEISSVSPNKN